MKKRLELLLIVALLLCCSANVFAADYSLEGGKAPEALPPEVTDRIPSDDQLSVTLSEDNAYPIANADDLKDFRDQVNSGNTTLNGYLMANIDLDYENWTPIGTSSNRYGGTFDGQGYRVDGLYVSQVSTIPAGLFAFTDGALICNLGLSGKINGGSFAGGFVGNAKNTTIASSYNKCTVVGYGPSAGIVGGMTGNSFIISCYNKGLVSNTSSKDISFNGGLVGIGADKSILSYCYNTGTVNAPNGSAGGIAGSIAREFLLLNSYNIGTVSGSSGTGSIVGYATEVAGVSNCYYLEDSYQGIGTNNSSYNHEVYYGDAALFKKADTIDLLNNSDNYFMSDIYNINNGYPILIWEEAPLPTYTISLYGGVVSPRTKAEPGEVIELLTPKANFVGWSTVPNIEITSGDVGDYIYGLFTMPNSNVTITANYKQAIVFSDVPAGAWYEGVVYDLVGKGIIDGKGNNEFVPNGQITRAEFAKILAFASGDDLNQYEGRTSFGDVPTGKWFSNSVEWAYQNGVVKGKENGYAPNDNISRQEMAVMIKRYADYKGIILPEINAAVTFNDDAEIASWAKAEVVAMQKAGIINGKPGNIFVPRGNATRAEACKMISELLKI